MMLVQKGAGEVKPRTKGEAISHAPKRALNTDPARCAPFSPIASKTTATPVATLFHFIARNSEKPTTNGERRTQHPRMTCNRLALRRGCLGSNSCMLMYHSRSSEWTAQGAVLARMTEGSLVRRDHLHGQSRPDIVRSSTNHEFVSAGLDDVILRGRIPDAEAFQRDFE